MIGLAKKLLQDEHGFVVSAEMVCISTLTVVGVIGGLACLRDAVVCEMKEVGSAIRSVDQSYFYTGHHGCYSRCGLSSWTAGSSFGCTPLCPQPVIEDREYLLRTVPAEPTPAVQAGPCPQLADPPPPTSAGPCPQPAPQATPAPMGTTGQPMVPMGQPAPAPQVEPKAQPMADPPAPTTKPTGHRPVIIERSA